MFGFSRYSRTCMMSWSSSQSNTTAIKRINTWRHIYGVTLSNLCFFDLAFFALRKSIQIIANYVLIYILLIVIWWYDIAPTYFIFFATGVDKTQLTLYIDYRIGPIKRLCVVNKSAWLDRSFSPFRFLQFKFYVWLFH